LKEIAMDTVGDDVCLLRLVPAPYFLAEQNMQKDLLRQAQLDDIRESAAAAAANSGAASPQLAAENVRMAVELRDTQAQLHQQAQQLQSQQAEAVKLRGMLTAATQSANQNQQQVQQLQQQLQQQQNQQQQPSQQQQQLQQQVQQLQQQLQQQQQQNQQQQQQFMPASSASRNGFDQAPVQVYTSATAVAAATSVTADAIRRATAHPTQYEITAIQQGQLALVSRFVWYEPRTWLVVLRAGGTCDMIMNVIRAETEARASPTTRRLRGDVISSNMRVVQLLAVQFANEYETLDFTAASEPRIAELARAILTLRCSCADLPINRAYEIANRDPNDVAGKQIALEEERFAAGSRGRGVRGGGGGNRGGRGGGRGGRGGYQGNGRDPGNGRGGRGAATA
jgi:chemotaxis protein histidine kinase CheA